MHREAEGVKGEPPAMGRAKTKRVEQGEATRAALIDAARHLFTEQGFAATGTHDVVRAAGVTRGPLYYHFTDKTDLFKAVFIDLEKELNRHVIAAATEHDDPWEMFLAGCEACLDFFLRDDYRQIVLVDGPAVLGLPLWHELDAELGSGTMAAGVKALADAGVVAPRDSDCLATLLFGAINHAGMSIARSNDPAGARSALLAEFENLLAGVRGGQDA